MLEIDEGSRLGRESLAGGIRYSAASIPPDDEIADFYEIARTQLSAAGYASLRNLELGAARNGVEAQSEILAPGARISDLARARILSTAQQRWANNHDPAQYVACIEKGISPREQIESVTPDQALDEEFFLGLRQLDGVDMSRISREYGGSLSGRVATLQSRIASLCHAGSDGNPRANACDSRQKKLSISNEVLVELLG